MTSADSHPLLQEPKPKSSTLKKVGVAAIALSFVLGSIAGTVANGRGVTSLIDTPSDDTAAAPAPAPAQDPAPAPAQEPAQEPITEDPGSNGGCPPAGSTTEEDCKAAGCTWAPGVYPADVTTNGGICIPTPADPNMPKIKSCHHHEYVCRYHHHDGHCCEYKCVGSKDSCHALPGGKVESSAGGHAYEDSDGALGRKALAAAATAVLAGLAF